MVIHEIIKKNPQLGASIVKNIDVFPIAFELQCELSAHGSIDRLNRIAQLGNIKGLSPYNGVN